MPTYDAHPIYLAGRGVESPRHLEVNDPAHSGRVAGSTFLATEEQYEAAAVAAVRGFEAMRVLPTVERAAALRKTSDDIAARRDENAALVARESGKSIRDARVETDRGVLVFRLAAEEAERLDGEIMPLDVGPAHKGRHGLTRRFPVGPVAGISPFNFPLNLAAHKVAPAIAGGCSIVLKPPSRDPLTMLVVAEIIDEAGLPDGAVSVLPMDRERGAFAFSGRSASACSACSYTRTSGSRSWLASWLLPPCSRRAIPWIWPRISAPWSTPAWCSAPSAGWPRRWPTALRCLPVAPGRDSSSDRPPSSTPSAPPRSAPRKPSRPWS